MVNMELKIQGKTISNCAGGLVLLLYTLPAVTNTPVMMGEFKGSASLFEILSNTGLGATA
jgi:hypothetical protein